MVVIVGSVEPEEIRRHNRGCEVISPNPHDLWLPAVVLRELPSVGPEELPRRCEMTGPGSRARVVGQAKGIPLPILKLPQAIEANDWAHDNIPYLELFSDSARRSRRDYESGSDLGDNLLPHKRVRKLWTVL